MDTTADDVRRDALPLHGQEDLDPLLARVGDARHVLIGEASHGTSEFYRWRAELTRRLIAEHGFSFVAVEGDWPDCHRLHCCVAGAPEVPGDPAEVLLGFDRWPRWMWANEEVLEFARWLRAFNARRDGPPVGFHGLDVYSLWDSLRAVLGYLREHEPEHVDTALAAFRCFEPYREDPQAYGFASTVVPDTCVDEVVRLLRRLREQVDDLPAAGLDPRFVARQNAEVVAGAERYYREMVRGDRRSWNVRDHHMTDTLDRLLEAYGPGAKSVVWAHNTHVGDARATDMAAAGLVNIGQLARERYGAGDVALVGFGTYEGSVIAGDFWGGPQRRMAVPEAGAGSLEALLHEVGTDVLILLDAPRGWAGQVRGHRAIGVVYDPRRERRGNYVPTVPARRYDAFLFCDRTSALRPLHATEPVPGEAETYPTGQ
ncbi:Erythromycin esterase homolog [Amycolatopsis arida]|uniref:Erythromycin esterase homolog n=1 Tax=Amycolatopsis arida TaxID=587909 RepID=A0A1I5YVE1_9PSEU|nr:erythromycin esterase family protein [Amycolatopsis arida]TDX89919.1 erythromycin esterase-like protein [Amycolatopsis arida]SFQ48238.1 Erythromycin esterase homolog [Amycolatopsis arida]